MAGNFAFKKKNIAKVLQFPLVTVIWQKKKTESEATGLTRHNYQLFALITMMDYNTLPAVRPVAARKTGPSRQRN